MISSLTSVAEDHFSGAFSIGAKGGVSLSQTTFSPSVPQKFHSGPMAGIMFRYIEENHFGLIGEVNFEQRGWKENFEEAPYSYSRDLSYIQIPLLAHIYFGSEKAKFFFNAGPEIGFMIAEKTNSNFDINNFSSLEGFPSENRNTEQFAMPIKHKVDYGISAGIGAEWAINRKNSILIEGRFYYGLNNIFGANKKIYSRPLTASELWRQLDIFPPEITEHTGNQAVISSHHDMALLLRRYEKSGDNTYL